MRIAKLAIVVMAVLSSLPAKAIEIAWEQDSSLPIVYVNIAVRGGVVTDPDGQSGLTNFMGEMLLRGTKARSKEQIDLALDQMGATLEVEARAESLIFRGAVLSSQLDPYLRLVDEILTQPSFPEVEIKKLKSEIISGILEELGHDPSLAARRFVQFLFRDHPYGKPILGKLKDVEKLTQAQILAQYDHLIRNRNLLVIGTGDATEATMTAWANGLASKRPDAPGTSGELPTVATPEAPQTRRLMIIDKPDRTQTQINGGQIGIRMTDKDYFPLYLGNHAFGGGSFSSTLMVEIRVKRGWSYGANSYFRQGLKPRSWQFHLFPASKDAPAALEETLKLVQNLKDHGITQADFDFAKQSLVNSSGFLYNTPKKRVENKLLERTLDLPDGFIKSTGPEIAKVSLGDVNAALARFITPDRLSIAVLGTAKELKEPLAKAAGVPVDKVEVVPYTQE